MKRRPLTPRESSVTRPLPDASTLSTTERVVQVLLAIAHSDTPLGVSELARQLNVSKSVVHRVLRTFVDVGLAVQDESDRRYRLGPMAYALGRRTSASDRLYRAGMPALAHLGELTGETTIMSARIGHRRCYIGQVVSPHQVRITIAIGQDLPLSVGASGLCMLAFMPPEDIELILRVPVQAFTERTMTDTDAVRRRLEEIHERGWATSAGERVPMSASIATPILGNDELPVGAISVAYLDTRIDNAKLPQYGELIMEQAREVSNRYNAITFGPNPD